jgi:hypothetical protein
LLDKVILSRATGFLGTHGSTSEWRGVSGVRIVERYWGSRGGAEIAVSIIAMRRVIDWNGGIGRWISWGHSIPEGWEWAWHQNRQ